MPEELKLLPCPACGGEGLFYLRCGDEYYIPCKECDLRSPLECCPDLALAAWNALPRVLAWTKEPPTTPGTYSIIYKDKTVDIIHYFKLPSEEEVDGAAYWLGPLPPVFGIICDMDKEPTP